MKSQSDLSNEAWENYDKSQYENVADGQENDVVIIFDRTYYKTVETTDDQVYLFTTIHRKIKINSLYGLEQYNKLYVPTFKDLHFRVELLNCKAKTLKENNPSVITDTSSFVSTTLPANTPFFYKKKGNVKLLAINDISIGDELEYVFTIKHIYDYPPKKFYKTDRVNFSNNYLCNEKSFYFESDSYETKIWPYNFNNGITKKTDFKYKNGEKISLKNINKKSNNLYVNDNLDQPYIYYQIAFPDEDNHINNTWESFVVNFEKSDIKRTEHYNIFEGEKKSTTIYKMSKIASVKSKYELLLKKLNSPLEKRKVSPEFINNNIDMITSYAKIISKTLKALRLPANFHFVVNKNYGTFDSSFVSLYQFDDILLSFVDETGKANYMSLLVPFSELNETKLEFQETNCFIISQNETGKKTYSFDRIPKSNKINLFRKDIKVNLVQVSLDSINYEINECATYEGDSWINIKPMISYILKDSINTQKKIKKFIMNQIVNSNRIDSISDVVFKIDSTFSISYNYSIKLKNVNNTSIINLQLKTFLKNNYYTPYYLRGNRERSGYLYSEPDVHHTITFNLIRGYRWMENMTLKENITNSIGSLVTKYDYSSLKFSFKFKYLKKKFDNIEWNELVLLRDRSYDFLSSNLYFKKE